METGNGVREDDTRTLEVLEEPEERITAAADV